MPYLFAVLTISMIALSLSYLLEKPMEKTLALAMLLIIMVLYVFGLFGWVYQGFFLCVALSVGCLIGIMAQAIMKRRIRKLYQRLFTPGFVVFLVMVVVVWKATGGRQLVIWDEFSHWGLAPKNLFLLHSLGGGHPSATTIFTSYPPAVPLIQYYFLRIANVFTEHTLYRAVDLFLVALILPVFSGFAWKDWKKVLLIAGIVFSLPLMFYPDLYYSVYVDGTMGLLFAYILFSYFSQKEGEKGGYLACLMASFVLVLTKPSGQGIAFISLCILVTDYIVRRKGKRNLIPLLTLLVSILAAYFSWKLYLQYTAGAQIHSATSVLDRFTGFEGLSYAKTIIRNFAYAATNATSFGGGPMQLSYFLWIFMLGVLTYLVTVTKGKNEQLPGGKKYVFGLSVAAGFVVYMISVLVTYIAVFSEYEAVTLASFERYMNAYLLGGCLFLTFLLVQNQQSYQKPFHILFGFGGVLFLFLNPIHINNSFFYTDTSSTVEQRMPYAFSQRFSEYLAPSDTVCFISQNDDRLGYDFYVTHYNATPIRVYYYRNWSLGEPYGEDDRYTQNATLEEWETDLRSNATHVYLYGIDDQFIQRYGGLFLDVSDIQNDTLYRVDKEESIVRLVPLPLEN